MHDLKHDPKIQELLGPNVHHNSDQHQVSGTVNMFKGDADLTFEVQGDNDSGLVNFKGFRRPERGDIWQSQIYRVKALKSGNVLDLNLEG
jgi:hypothetical protein